MGWKFFKVRMDFLLISILIFLFLRILFLISIPKPVLVDENITIYWGSNYNNLIQILRNDFHPPLIYLITFNIFQLTDSVILTRVFFFLFSILSLCVIYHFSNLFEKGNKLLLSLWILLLATNIGNVFFSIHIRPYIILTFLFILSSFIVYKIIDLKIITKKEILALGVIYGFGVSLHYYTFIFIASHMIILLIYYFLKILTIRNITNYTLSLIIAFLIFTPSLPLFLSQLSNAGEYFKPKVSFELVLIPFWHFATSLFLSKSISHSFYLLSLLVFISLTYCFLRGVLIHLKRKNFFILLNFFIPMILTFILAIIGIAPYLTRYLSYLLPFYSLLTAIGLFEVKMKNNKYFFCLLIIMLAYSLIVSMLILIYELYELVVL